VRSKSNGYVAMVARVPESAGNRNVNGMSYSMWFDEIFIRTTAYEGIECWRKGLGTRILSIRNIAFERVLYALSTYVFQSVVDFVEHEKLNGAICQVKILSTQIALPKTHDSFFFDDMGD
jgi:hypothetical protein